MIVNKNPILRKNAPKHVLDSDPEDGDDDDEDDSLSDKMIIVDWSDIVFEIDVDISISINITIQRKE